MRTELITQRDDLVIRRHTLEAGESVAVPVPPGLSDWDEPEPRVHRAVNVSAARYEEVVMFFLDSPGIDPQPEHP